MVDYVKISRYEEGNQIGVVFDVTADKPAEVAEKMEAIDENAYMNGYNWEAFFNFYLAETAPELLDGIETDSEAETYVAYYELSDEGEKKAEKFAKLIESLIEGEDELLRIVRERGSEIEWD
ncbi:MAG: hypothetical protein IKU86_03200 [Thermoguttaceae bacterium]|nr:hypothetical protein [Thermoguttaceae bacterium]